MNKNHQHFLDYLGLNRKELVAWALYDWGNSAYVTIVMATILPIYYNEVAAHSLDSYMRTAMWGYTCGIALLLSACVAPFLGTLADHYGVKKKMLSVFLIIALLANAALFFVDKNEWILASLLFIISSFGFYSANIFYEAILPHICNTKELDKVSSAGYALGYMGGGLMLVFTVLLVSSKFTFVKDSVLATKIAFVLVSVWWGVFSIPLFVYIKEPIADKLEIDSNINNLMSVFLLSVFRLKNTFKDIKKYKNVLLFLLAFWFYSEGIGTIIKMATIYGKELGISNLDLLGSFILVQFIGVPATFVFVYFAYKVGTKKAIIGSLFVYTCICVFGYFMKYGWHFWILAVFVALVQGGCQALSRSFYAKLIPVNKSSEFFSFFAISEKFAGILGPIFFSFLSQIFKNSRFSIIGLIIFFIFGIIILTRIQQPNDKLHNCC